MSNRFCPKCKCEYSAPSALSRVDNKTEICPECAGVEPLSCESYVAVGTEEEMKEYPRDDFLPDGFTDEDIHYYFYEQEFKDGEVETEEFKYLIGKRVA